jgi:carboxyl-terminal processing protease
LVIQVNGHAVRSVEDAHRALDPTTVQATPPLCINSLVSNQFKPSKHDEIVWTAAKTRERGLWRVPGRIYRMCSQVVISMRFVSQSCKVYSVRLQVVWSYHPSIRQRDTHRLIIGSDELRGQGAQGIEKVEKTFQTVLIGFLMVVMPGMALAVGEGHHTSSSDRHGIVLPRRALQALQKSQGVIEVRMERLDGTLEFRRGAGLIVDDKRGFVVASTHAIPQFKAAFKDDDAVVFYQVGQEHERQRVPAYAFAVSFQNGLVFFQLDGSIPEGMGEIGFANEMPVQSAVYAQTPTFIASAQGTVPSRDHGSRSFRGHLVQGTSAGGDAVRAVRLDDTSLDPESPTELFGGMFVDAHGRFVGMGNGVDQGHTTLTNAHTINTMLHDVRRAELAMLDKGEVTPRDTYTINKMSRVFEQILLLHATEALERPRHLWECAYEMFAMEASGSCRDRFSSFLSPARVRQSEQAMLGVEGTVNLEMDMRTGRVVVAAPVANTPVAAAEIRSGDAIIEIDGQRIQNVAQATEALRGRPGTPVAIRVRRRELHGEVAEHQFRLTRELAPIQTVHMRIVTPGYDTPVGVVRIDRMLNNTAEQFQAALDQLRAQGIAHVVFDVRDNPGGSMNAALRMLALFMQTDDTALLVRKRDGEQIFDADLLTAKLGIQDYGRYRHFRIVVLINGGSASAAEIFAGALQDWGYTVVGERSYGKGVAQQSITLHDGSMMLLSTIEFLVGNHAVPIRDIGVKPDIEVHNQHTVEDGQLAKAIHLLLTPGTSKMAHQ